jgi:endonuclease YncB( thermonuclease family)
MAPFHVKIRALAALAALLLLASCDEGRQFSGKVVSIADGDTLTVLHAGKQERVRLYGVDCPEKKQPFGTRARQFAGELVFQKVVTVRIKDRDRYGRTVGEVVLPDGRILNQELVRAGLAWWYREYAAADVRLALLEREARAAARGVWSDPNAVPPWEYRKRGRAAAAAKF